MIYGLAEHVTSGRPMVLIGLDAESIDTLKAGKVVRVTPEDHVVTAAFNLEIVLCLEDDLLKAAEAHNVTPTLIQEAKQI